MKNEKVILIFLALSSVVFFNTGCKEEGCMDPISLNYNPDAEEDDGSCEYGGQGGSLTLVAKPRHHSTPIFSTTSYPDSAFLKFNATNLPGTNPSDFDLVVVGEDGEDHVHITGLKRGKYFIYMTGFDPAISQRVSGGIPIEIIETSGEYIVNVPVTE